MSPNCLCPTHFSCNCFLSPRGTTGLLLLVCTVFILLTVYAKIISQCPLFSQKNWHDVLVFFHMNNVRVEWCQCQGWGHWNMGSVPLRGFNNSDLTLFRGILVKTSRDPWQREMSPSHRSPGQNGCFDQEIQNSFVQKDGKGRDRGNFKGLELCLLSVTVTKTMIEQPKRGIFVISWQLNETCLTNLASPEPDHESTFLWTCSRQF